MTRILKLLLLTAFALALGSPAFAQPRIAVVDLRGVVTNYWRTKQLEKNLNDQKAESDKEMKSFEDDLKKLAEEYKKANEAAAETAVSESEREKRRAAAEKKFREAKDLEETARTYQRQAGVRLEETMRRMLDTVLRDIRAAINEVSKAGNYSLVLDLSGAMAPYNTSPVLFSSGEFDITEAVNARLDKSRPLEFSKPVEPKAPTPEPEKKSGKK